MSTITHGELFAGYGGLGLAVEEVFGAELAWYAEFDPAPSKIMAHHYPGITNHGDVTTIDWATVPPVDIISGGSPCQDLSLAGRRQGMTAGTRSNLWESMREAIATIKPTYVIWENVRGAYSAKATSASDLEPGEGPLGDRSGGHLRALGRVLGDLADLGYDCQWRGLRAADVGAPHARFRVFLLATRRDATTQNAHLSARNQRRLPAPGQAQSGGARADASRRGGAPAPNAGSTTLGEHPGGSLTEEAGTRASHRPGDSHGERTDRDGRETAPDTHGGDDARRLTDQIGAKERGTAPTGSGGIDWGPYEPAIRRWEAVRGTAPAPTELNTKGKHRLSPAFTEFMMGLPAGWVTAVPTISRNDQLKACGNGVVPQQAAAALRHMIANAPAADEKEVRG